MGSRSWAIGCSEDWPYRIVNLADQVFRQIIKCTRRRHLHLERLQRLLRFALVEDGLHRKCILNAGLRQRVLKEAIVCASALQFLDRERIQNTLRVPESVLPNGLPSLFRQTFGASASR